MPRLDPILLLSAGILSCDPGAFLAAQVPVEHTGNSSSAAHDEQRKAMGDAALGDGREGEAKRVIVTALRQKAVVNQGGAFITLQEALIRWSHDVTLLRDLALQALELKRLAFADSAARETHSLDPNDPEALYVLARIECEEDFFVASRNHFQGYLAIKPEEASAHYGFGHLLQRNQDHDGATAEFRRSLELQPVQTKSYYQPGQMALDDGRDQEANAPFERVFSRTPRHGGALTGLGVWLTEGTISCRGGHSLNVRSSPPPITSPLTII